MNILFFPQIEPGIIFSSKTYPICLPFESNGNHEKWQNRNVEIVGFATQDFTGSKGDVMKVAEVDIFSRSKCNTELDKELDKNKACKSAI